MRLRYKLLIALVLLFAAFATGRFTTPTKTVTEIKTVTVTKEVEKKETDWNKVRHKKVIETITIKPDGTKVVTRTVTDDTSSNGGSKETDEKDSTTSTDKRTEVVKSESKTTISGLAGYRLGSSEFDLGVAATRPILGPITIGVFGLKSGLVGASIGLTF